MRRSTPIDFIIFVLFGMRKFSMATSRHCLPTDRVCSFVYANGNVNSNQSDLSSRRAGRANDAPRPAFKRDCNSKSLRYKFPIIKWMPRFIGGSISRGIACIRTCTAIFIRRIQSSDPVKYCPRRGPPPPPPDIASVHIEHSLIFIRLSVMTVTPKLPVACAICIICHDSPIVVMRRLL